MKIEVTAEDGSIKKYFVYIRRLSAKDATLSGLKTDIGILNPEFNPAVYDYSG